MLGTKGNRGVLMPLAFLTNSMLMILCAPEDEDLAATDQLLRPAFGLARIEWSGDFGVEFHLTHADWRSQ